MKDDINQEQWGKLTVKAAKKIKDPEFFSYINKILELNTLQTIQAGVFYLNYYIFLRYFPSLLLDPPKNITH